MRALSGQLFIQFNDMKFILIPLMLIVLLGATRNKILKIVKLLTVVIVQVVLTLVCYLYEGLQDCFQAFELLHLSVYGAYVLLAGNK